MAKNKTKSESEVLDEQIAKLLQKKAQIASRGLAEEVENIVTSVSKIAEKRKNLIFQLALSCRNFINAKKHLHNSKSSDIVKKIFQAILDGKFVDFTDSDSIRYVQIARVLGYDSKTNEYQMVLNSCKLLVNYSMGLLIFPDRGAGICMSDQSINLS
jgi:hypothetical protein